MNLFVDHRKDEIFSQFSNDFTVNILNRNNKYVCQGTDLIQELTTIYKTKDEEGRES